MKIFITILILFIAGGTMAGKDITERIAKGEAAYEMLDPESYYRDKPALKDLPSEEKLAAIAQGIVNAGAQALLGGAKGYVPMQPSPQAGTGGQLAIPPGIKVGTKDDIDIAHEERDSGALYQHPEATGGVPTNPTELLMAKEGQTKIDDYNSAYMSWLAQENARIQEQNKYAAEQNAKSWGLVPGVFPEEYEKVAKMYEGTGGGLDPVSGLHTYALRDRPMKAPEKFERPMAPVGEKWASKTWSNSVMDKFGKNAYSPGQGPKANYGGYRPILYNPADPQNPLSQQGKNWENFYQPMINSQYTSMGHANQMLYNNAKQIFELGKLTANQGFVAYDKDGKDIGGKKGDLISMAIEAVKKEIKDNPKGSVASGMYVDGNGNLAGWGDKLGSYKKLADNSWVWTWNGQANNTVTGIDSILTQFIEKNYGKVKDITLDHDSTDSNLSIAKDSDPEKIKNAVREYLSYYIMATRTGGEDIIENNGVPVYDANGDIQYKGGKKNYDKMLFKTHFK